MEQVSVEQALRKGAFWLKGIPMLLFMASFIGPMILVAMDVIGNAWLIALGFPLGIVMAWLWWSFAVTRWRIWSLERVRNVHELLALAVQEKLIWRKGHWLERTEIRTQSQREQLMALKARLAIPDERLDDPGIPPATVVGYAKGQATFILLFGLVILGIAIQQFGVSKGNGWIIIFYGAVGTWMLIDGLRKLMRKRPVLVVDQQGITTRSKQFHPWSGIFNERVIVKGSGRSTRHLLVFDHPGGEVEFNIGALAISKGALRHALKVHRLRWEMGNTAR